MVDAACFAVLGETPSFTSASKYARVLVFSMVVNL
jgi:hypothetical protein